jgi:hypothetical protein
MDQAAEPIVRGIQAIILHHRCSTFETWNMDRWILFPPFPQVAKKGRGAKKNLFLTQATRGENEHCRAGTWQWGTSAPTVLCGGHPWHPLGLNPYGFPG